MRQHRHKISLYEDSNLIRALCGSIVTFKFAIVRTHAHTCSKYSFRHETNVFAGFALLFHLTWNSLSTEQRHLNVDVEGNFYSVRWLWKLRKKTWKIEFQNKLLFQWNFLKKNTNSSNEFCCYFWWRLKWFQLQMHILQRVQVIKDPSSMMILHSIRPDQLSNELNQHIWQLISRVFWFCSSLILIQISIELWDFMTQKADKFCYLQSRTCFVWRKIMWIKMVFLTISRLSREKVREPFRLLFKWYYCTFVKWETVDRKIHLFVYLQIFNQKYQLRFIDSLRLNVKGGHGGKSNTAIGDFFSYSFCEYFISIIQRKWLSQIWWYRRSRWLYSIWGSRRTNTYWNS